MTRNTSLGRTRLYVAAAGILLVGLGSALAVYLTAGNPPDTVVGYGMENGTLYQIAPEDTKTYSRSLEMYGGKANVLVDEFRQWFVGLWQGRPLAYTIACLTVVLVIALLVAAHRQQREDDDEDDGKGAW
ncbi:MAG TPA: hypothetical protein VIH45_03730 [Desulfuromonadaceae bacterium]